MRILVTGGAGYIGSHAVKLFLERGHDVLVYDNLVHGHREAVPAGRLVVGDIGDVDRLDQLLSTNPIEAVVHFAAYAYVGESVFEPAKYYQNNLMLSLGMLEVLRRHRIQRFVFSSSCATYGILEHVPVTEDSRQSPINPYGWTKMALERALEDYSRAYGWKIACLRYFNAAGASCDGSLGEDHTPETHLIPQLFQVALKQRSHIDILGTDYETPDGTCIRDYVHVEDLAQAHLLALEALESKDNLAYNIGTEQGNSVREVIALAGEVAGVPIAVNESARRPGDPPVLVASSRKIRKELGWKPKYPEIRQILESAWNWHQSHPNGFRTVSTNNASAT